MRCVQQSNRWSCLPTAFAIATDHSVQEILRRIGHDGSEIVWPDLPDPQCRRSFHVQECILAIADWYYVMPLDQPAMMTPDGKRILEIKTRAMDFIVDGYGVCTGTGTRNRHAVAFQGNGQTIRFYDPNGLEYDFENQYFTPQTYWLISEK